MSGLPDTIGIMGAGAWGTALAFTALQAGRAVRMHAREPEVAAALNEGRGNPLYLPGIDLPPIPAFTDPSGLAGADAILAVVPAQFARGAFEAAAPYISAGTPVLLCSKGIERGSLCLMTDILGETVPGAIPAVLSGPSFAADVARGLPTAVTLACEDETLGARLMQAIGRPTFRPYWSGDLVGAEVGGAVKNVLAIACGMVEGLGLGKSAHAALLTRGFSEMRRLGAAMGAERETLSGLCGLGDLVLTCSSPQSRNMSFGRALGEGQSAAEFLAARKAVTEGAETAPALVELAARKSVDMPICKAVNRILSGAITVREAMDDLLSRPFREEN